MNNGKSGIMDLREKVSNSSKKTLTAAAILLFGVVMLAGAGFSQTSGTGDVVIDQNGVKLNTGTLDVNGNDIEDAGTTIWDQSAGQIATAAVDYSAATASDVGLENVQNEAQVAESGDTMTGDLTFDSTQINSATGNYIQPDNGGGNLQMRAEASSTSDLNLEADDEVRLSADTDSSDGGFYSCYIDVANNGDWVCDGSKSWAHDLDNGSEAVYTSQESPEVRAVYEGQTTVTDSKKVELPEHFSKTVSDSEPKLRVQVTPQGTLTNAAAMDVTDDYVEIAVQDETEVHYRVTGIREGYEDKQVVRPKE